MDSNNQYPTMWTTGYVGGVKVSFTFPIRNEMEAYAQAKAITDKLLADGFTTEAPGLVAGEEREVIVTVMRRSKPSDETIIIDFYTEWGAGADEPFGTYKYLHIYMDKDKPEMIAEFLKFSGFKRIEDIPLYDAQASLKRTFGKKHPKETAVPTPFKIVKKQGAEKVGSDGKSYKPWEFVRYEVMNTPPPPTATAPASVTTAAVQDDPPSVGWETEQRIKALTALDNEMITIFKVRYEPAHNGMGVERWIATARVLGGGTVPVVVYGEDARKVVDAGHKWPKTDGDDLNIGVITAMKGSDRRITSVEPLESQPEAEERAWDAEAWDALIDDCKSKGIELASVLGVSRGSQWKRGYNAAVKAIDAYVAKHSGNVDFMAESEKKTA